MFSIFFTNKYINSGIKLLPLHCIIMIQRKYIFYAKKQIRKQMKAV